MLTAELAERLRGRFPDPLEARGEVTVVAEPNDLLDDLAWLRETPELAFDCLSDVAATDWPDAEPRFWLAYHLRSMEHGHRLRVKVGLSGAEDPPRVPSVTPMFPTGNWLEREVFDFFGVVFDGHPDLRRIEMPEDWEGYPLRKTEPLAGVNTQYKQGAFIPPPDERGL
jgi:NADH-quinone oxidoreductase subunit C